jgi:hypothetical protein
MAVGTAGYQASKVAVIGSEASRAVLQSAFPL